MLNILNVIEAYWSRGRGAWEKGAHYPSEMTQCRRQIFWKWKGEKESNPTEATGFWRMRIGDAIHDGIVGALKAIAEDDELREKFGWPGMQVEAEVRTGRIMIDGSAKFGGVSLDLPMSGRVDCKFIDQEGRKAVLEIKTTFGRGVRAQKEEGLKLSQLVQGIFYLLALEDEGVERVYYPIVSRDDGDRFQVAIEILGEYESVRVSRVYESETTAVLAEVPFGVFVDQLKRLRDVELALAEDKVPDRDFMVAIKNGEIRREFQHQNVKYKSDWQCMYCQFRDRCWAPVVEQFEKGNNAEDVAAHQAKQEEGKWRGIISS